MRPTPDGQAALETLAAKTGGTTHFPTNVQEMKFVLRNSLRLRLNREQEDEFERE